MKDTLRGISINFIYAVFVTLSIFGAFTLDNNYSNILIIILVLSSPVLLKGDDGINFKNLYSKWFGRLSGLIFLLFIGFRQLTGSPSMLIIAFGIFLLIDIYRYLRVKTDRASR